MEMENKEYQFMYTFLKNKYIISTAYRKASMPFENVFYFETIVWEWNSETRKIGSILEIDDSGIDEEQAIKNHLLMVKKMNNLINNEKK